MKRPTRKKVQKTKVNQVTPKRNVKRKYPISKSNSKIKKITNRKTTKEAGHRLSGKEIQELKNMTKEMTKEAKKVVTDYKENPSEMSGSVVEINQDSPYLDERFEGNQWQKVVNKIPKDLTISEKNNLEDKLSQQNVRPKTPKHNTDKPSWAKGNKNTK